MTDTNKPAFPHITAIGHKEYAPGLTVREYAAIKAMQGILAACSKDGYPTHEMIVKYAIKNADALILELAKEMK